MGGNWRNWGNWGNWRREVVGARVEGSARVVAEKRGEASREEGADAVDEGVEPGGVDVSANEVGLEGSDGTKAKYLEREELLEDVDDGVGLEEEREGGLPELEAGAAQLGGEFGGAGAGLGGVEAGAQLAVEQRGGQREQLPEEGQRGLLLPAQKGRQRDGAQRQRGKLGKRQREQREEAVHVDQIVGRAVARVLLPHQLRVTGKRGNHGEQRVELELEHQGRGRHADVAGGGLLLGVVEGETRVLRGAERYKVILMRKFARSRSQSKMLSWS